MNRSRYLRQMLEDVRTYARLQRSLSDMTREQYIAAVLAYALEHHGTADEVRMHAERTARYFWAIKPAHG